ncbi:MAG: IMP dehydrogenase [candidate division Zixibacteria bacterium]|nr:IMP dehydrogenase [candidate division Zixibacteria bacterium]
MGRILETTGLTFDDVLVVPGYAEIHPREVSVSTRLSRSIRLNIPLVSAAMDTVTESELAISLAREGGIGIIHKNLSIARQAEEIDKVKRSEAGMIVNPITVGPNQTVADAITLMERYSISGIPVVQGGRLVGILTNRDLRFHPSLDTMVSAVMTKNNLITVPEGTTPEQAKEILHEHRIEKLPIVDENMNLKGMITFKDIMKKLQYPNACKDASGRLRVGAALGVGSDIVPRAAAVIEAGVDILCLDSSHGHSAKVIETAHMLKKLYPQVELIAGNVATRDGAQALIDAGADAVKVGIGPGAICTTRVISGGGVPQITAIMEAVEAAAKQNVPVIADGGIRYSGDIVKAIAAGAHSIMVGSLLAGTHESPGETILLEGRSFKVYRGMGSIGAMKDGAKDRYFQEDQSDMAKLVPEGIEGRVPYKGKLSDLVFQLVGGIRSGMGLAGAKNIEDLRTKSTFVKVTTAGLRESHPHDVTIMKEAPNYRTFG